MRERGFDARLYRLLAWFSPGFPIGAFSYSHGLEAAADHSTVHDRETLQHWIAAVVTLGAGRMDAESESERDAQDTERRSEPARNGRLADARAAHDGDPSHASPAESDRRSAAAMGRDACASSSRRAAGERRRSIALPSNFGSQRRASKSASCRRSST